jgi:hypothetical protein
VNKIARKPATIILALIVLTLLWAAFRPELLLVNKHVDDPFPTTSAAASAPRL